MCKHLNSNGKCSLRMTDSFGRKYTEISIAIRTAFQEAAERSPIYKEAKLGVACGAQLCCFAHSKYVSFNDCPYFVI